MDLDELKQRWGTLEVRVERLEAAMVARRSQAALRGLRWRTRLGMACWVALVIGSATFWSAHVDVTHQLVAGLALHIYGIAGIVLGAIQLRALAAIDYGAPIVTLQRQLGELSRLRSRCSLALGLPWWFLWVPAMMVAFSALSGGDFYDAVWAWSSLGVGALGLLGCFAIARRHGAGPTGTRMFEDLAGRNLARARRELDDITRFATEA